MDFQHSERSLALQARLTGFMDQYVTPGEKIIADQRTELGDPHAYPPHLDELKELAREAGLWNLFLTLHGTEGGAGLTNVEYAPLAEIMGRTPNAAEVFNCAAPDTGNMEILSLFATDEQREQWLDPLLAGKIRSGFSMTEPDVASSDATNLQTRIERDGDNYVIHGRKWFLSGALNPRTKVLIVMGKTDADAPKHRQHSMILVPRDAPGVKIGRDADVYGYVYRGGHPEVIYDGVRVPRRNLIADEGMGFEIAQARLGPGRIHHAMRMVGIAELALDALIRRARTRTTFGTRVIDRDTVMETVAHARIEIEQVRLAVLKTAWLIDTVGAKGARDYIAMVKVAAPKVATYVLDRAIQVHGAGGFTNQFPLAELWAHARGIQMGDGPDEVHLRSLARTEIARSEHAE